MGYNRSYVGPNTSATVTMMARRNIKGRYFSFAVGRVVFLAHRKAYRFLLRDKEWRQQNHPWNPIRHRRRWMYLLRTSATWIIGVSKVDNNRLFRSSCAGSRRFCLTRYERSTQGRLHLFDGNNKTYSRTTEIITEKITTEKLWVIQDHWLSLRLLFVQLNINCSRRGGTFVKACENNGIYGDDRKEHFH